MPARGMIAIKQETERCYPMKQLSPEAIRRIKAALFLACLIPFVRLAVGTRAGTLGADPVEAITHTTGLWSLRFLLLTLAITPLKCWTGWLWLMRLRRTLALYAFFYASLHVAVYLLFDQYFDWPEILKDIAKRPHLTAGFAAFLLMIPLVITSTNAMMKRLGGRNWKMLHRLTYPIAAAAVLHFFWLVKKDVSEPTVYAAILSVLLCARLVPRPRKAPASPPLATHRPSPSS